MELYIFIHYIFPDITYISLIFYLIILFIIIFNVYFIILGNNFKKAITIFLKCIMIKINNIIILKLLNMMLQVAKCLYVNVAD